MKLLEDQNLKKLVKKRIIVTRSKLNLNNTNIIHANAYNVINNIQSDIVFIDPPWGGKFYKDFKFHLTNH